MNSLSGFNSQEIRRLHPYLSALLRRIEALEAGTGIGGLKIVYGGTNEGRGGVSLRWGADEDIQPTGNRNSAGELYKVARADHQHLFKFPTTAPASTPDGTAYFDPSASAIKVYVSNTPTTKVVAGATTADVQPTGAVRTGTASRYSFADHSHPTALLPQSNSQTPVVNEIRFNSNNKIVRWNGSAWVEMSVEIVEGGTNDDVQPTRLRSAGASTRFARADHSHPTAILPQGNSQTPVADEIRYNSNNKLVRWNGSAWVEMSVEIVEAGTDSDVQPTRLRSAGSSARFARADHSHPTALLPQSDTQTPVVNEIRVSADDKLVRWDGSDWVRVSVEEVEVGADADVRPTKQLSAGSAPRFARADHSHPTAILPQGDTQTPEADEIRYTAEDKLVRWDATAGQWVPLSVETFTIDWGADDDVQPTRLQSAGTSTRVARADHSHPTALLPQSDAQTPVENEIRFNADDKVVRWNGTDWVPLSVETFTVEWGTDDDVQATRLRSAGTATRFARADHSHPTALFPQSDTQTPVENEIRYNAENKIVRWDGTDWVPLSVETGGAETGTDNDVQPTRLRSAGTSTRLARADHSHPTAILPQSDNQTPVEGEIRYNDENQIVRWNGTEWVPLSVETFTADWGTDDDVQATGLRSAGTATRFARADHSHPTAILPEDDPQTPVEDEIRYNAEGKVVRWDGSDWVPLSVETFEIEWGTNSDVQATGARSAGTSTRFARADHSHPTVILPEDDPQTPVVNEIRYNPDNNLVIWDGYEWVGLSVIRAGRPSDVQATRLLDAGSSARYARADHSHPTAILPQTFSQSVVVDEIRYTDTNRLVRWNGTTWVEIVGALPVPATPLVLPYDTQVNSPQARQLVSVSDWDNIGDATVFYRDVNSSQYRLVFARPLAVSTASTPSGKNVWTNTANELVLKRGTGTTTGSVLWNRRGGTNDWSPVAPQLVNNADYSLPTDVGVLSRSPRIGASGNRRWFLRGVQDDDGTFRAPLVGFATFTEATVPATSDLATNLTDAYAYYIQDVERVDIVRQITNGNNLTTMLPHYVIELPCRVYSTATDSSGHYVRDEQWYGIWVVRFYTTTSATTDLFAVLPTISIPLGIQKGRVILYLHNPQSSAISTIFGVAVRRPTSTTPTTAVSSNTTVNIPANTTVVADLGVLSFSPSNTLSHHRSHPISVSIIRRRSLESANANSVMCLGAVIVPQRGS